MAWQKVNTVAEVKPSFLRDSPGFQLVPELTPLPSEVIFDKITLLAFEDTPLDIGLRYCGINSFIIAGVATEIGIEPTVRHGVDLGYIPIIVTDACGAGDAEAADQHFPPPDAAHLIVSAEQEANESGRGGRYTRVSRWVLKQKEICYEDSHCSHVS